MSKNKVKTIDCSPTEEGWAAAIVLLSSGIIGRVKSCEQDKVAELLDSIVEIAAYLGHKGEADLLADSREKVRRMAV